MVKVMAVGQLLFLGQILSFLSANHNENQNIKHKKQVPYVSVEAFL